VGFNRRFDQCECDTCASLLSKVFLKIVLDPILHHLVPSKVCKPKTVTTDPKTTTMYHTHTFGASKCMHVFLGVVVTILSISTFVEWPRVALIIINNIIILNIFGIKYIHQNQHET